MNQKIKSINRKIDIFLLQYPSAEDLAKSGRMAEFVDLTKEKLDVQDAINSRPASPDFVAKK